MNATKARLVADLKFEPAGGPAVKLQSHEIRGECGYNVEVSRWPDGTYAVCAVAEQTGLCVTTTDFGPPQYSLTEMQANFAIQEILDLDANGKRKDYFDEKPER